MTLNFSFLSLDNLTLKLRQGCNFLFSCNFFRQIPALRQERLFCQRSAAFNLFQPKALANLWACIKNLTRPVNMAINNELAGFGRDGQTSRHGFESDSKNFFSKTLAYLTTVISDTSRFIVQTLVRRQF